MLNFFKTTPVLIIFSLLAGCTAARLVTSNERSVIVAGAGEAWAQTTPIADAECAKYGRKAQFLYDKEGFPRKYFYDCVR